MALNPQTRAVVNALVREMASQRREIASLKRSQRAPQLAHSSLEEGQALEVRDENGNIRRRWGWIDGAVGEVTEGGDPVSAPSAPSVTPSLGGLRVTWDGTLSGDVAIPVDFDHMAVHVSTSAGFTPSAATYQGGIRRAGEGGMLPVLPLPYVGHYVVLVPVTTGGVQGVPSSEVAATPLQVDGPDLTAGSVTAATIAAGAVEADKLEAVLALASTIIAGIPGAARVEMDQDGLRGYNTANELVFAVDATGNAVFSGDIVASQISGSRMTIGTAPSAHGEIQEDAGVVQARVTSASGTRAQLSASSGQAEVTAWADPSTAGTPVGGMVALAAQVALSLQSASGDATQPWTEQNVFPGEARTRWSSGDGSEVLIRALPDHASILMTAPPAVDPDDAQGSGHIFAQRYGDDIAAISVQSPVWGSGTGPERGLRSMLHLEGARPDRAHTRVGYSGARHLFQQQYNMDTEVWDTADGVVELADTHSILAPRHEPVRSDLVANPSFETTGSYIDFTAGEFPPIDFKTGWSGKARITITAAGYNNATDTATLRLGFRLSGGSTVPADPRRVWQAESPGTGSVNLRHYSRTIYLNLVGNADYTLTPVWRIAPGSAVTAFFHTSFENSIVVEPLT
ncbi:hypothetical protein [Nocardiopsis synnemataformans]|uniref:hypothetical protein n=1 Tax=Nocardiopsis synnemataformans TaxID=61305 RepID=UPI003EB79696